jgi:cell division protein FtsI/penicillin-binding protein 2
MKSRSRAPALLVPIAAILLAGVAMTRADEAAPGELPPAEPPAAVAVSLGAAPVATGPAAPAPTAVAPAALADLPELARPAPTPPPAVGEPRLDPVLGRYVAPLGDRRATLTLDPLLQQRLVRSLETYKVPWGATVLLEPGTGRVLAMAEHGRADRGPQDLSLAARAPAASVFKIVTAAALLERGAADGEVCWHGGKRRLQPTLLRDDPRRDHRCSSLTSAFGHSTNVVFAKLADRDLDPETLRSTAERFLFNVPIPFSRPVEISRATIPDDPFAAANAAAGFGEVRLSALHGALLAAIVANGGVLVPPVLVDDADGAAAPEPPAPRRVVNELVAGRLAEMMRVTVVSGTARKAFRRAGGPLRHVEVAGKTGSLAEAKPYRDYTWFVGYAPADRPEVAIATVVANDRLWHARAPTVAKEALEAYFATRGLRGVTTAAR